MLKPTDPVSEPPPGERPIGELVHELVEEGKAYARAELDVVKTIATAAGKALLIPAGLFGVAFLVAMAAIMALAFGLFMELYAFMDPLLAGFISFLLFAAIAGGLGWYAVRRLKHDL
jgi:hypothetical protein